MKRIIGFDLGSKTLGIAITDNLGLGAWGLENFCFKSGEYYEAVSHALAVIEKEKVNDVVIGLALHMNGSESFSSLRANIFKEKLLEKKPKLNIVMLDERLSTVLAKRFLRDSNLSHDKQKKIIDMKSAIIILDTYLTQIKSKKNN